LSENRQFVQNLEILKIQHSHIFDIASIIFLNSEEFGRKGILGLAPSLSYPRDSEQRFV
jgi:hypothetical protein